MGLADDLLDLSFNPGRRSAELDNWLKRRALANEALGTSRTYVVTAGGRVVAFYALANGAVAQSTSCGPTLGFGAYRPTTKCIAASVETCSFTL